jgi:protein TonB
VPHHIDQRSVFSPACLVAVCVSAGIHVAALVVFIILAMLPYFYVPILVEAYGDNDREGFPDIEAVTLAPGTYRKGNEHTPGGDGQPKTSEPEPATEPPQPAEPVEPPKEPATPAAPVITQAAPPAEPEPPVPPSSVKPATNTPPPAASGSQSARATLPGASGGSQLPLGTPSAGGIVGSRNGVREARGARPPAYPRAAREAGIEGTVVIWLRVSAEGIVLEARVHKSSGHAILDDAALLWARKQRFIAARHGNTPVEAVATKPVHFYLY